MGTTAQKTPWLAEGEEKRSVVREIFADLAPSYDRFNDVISLRLHRRWRRAAVEVLGLEAGDAALDVCTGTGDFMKALAGSVDQKGTLLGIDFCAPMLEVARRKMPAAQFSFGDACRLPVASGRFDAVTVGWGLRNVPDIGAALREAARVLKPGGRFVTLDMARPRAKLFGRVNEAAFKRVAPFVGRLFGRSRAYRYLPESTQRFLDRDQMKAAMEQAGFRDVQLRDFFFGNVCMHWGVKP